MAIASGATGGATAGTTTRRTVKLASGATARKAVLAVLNSLPKHGPYRMTFTFADTGAASSSSAVMASCEFVPPDRDHCIIDPAGAAVETLTVGKQSWTKPAKGAPWQPVTDGSADSSSPLPAAGDVVSATERASATPGQRRFAVVVKDSPKNTPGSVIVDRQGRLRTFSVIGSKGTTTFAFTYDATIRISAPA